MKKNLRIVVCIFFVLLLSGCLPKTIKESTAEIYSMDTIMNLSVYGDNADDALSVAQEEILRIEKLLSFNLSDSEISSINRNAGAPVSAPVEVIDLMSTAVALSERTDGAFDITVAPCVSAWGFHNKEYTVASPETLDSLLPLVGSENIRLDAEANTVTLTKPGMSIDLGGIAKGYTSDVLSHLLKRMGVTSALLSLGGNITAVGTKPNGDPWRIAIQDPADSSAYVGILSISDLSVITSGSYERYFEVNGIPYHHIIDPKTGAPADSGLLSVTIISQNPTAADALSTGLFVMGLEKASALWRSSSDFEVVFVTNDGKVLASEGIADRFEFFGESNECEYEIIKR